jgi:uncharacterized membrane protein (UPF0182 family)
MVASSDWRTYGQLTTYEMQSEVNGPSIVADTINTTPAISEILLEVNRQGSSASFGNMVVVPIANQLLYVRPLYQSASGNTSVQFLKYVILSVGDEVVFDTTLPGALAKLFEDDDGNITPQGQAGIDAIEAIFDQTVPVPGPGEEVPPEEQTAAELLAQAEADFEEAAEILANMDGLDDLGRYERLVNDARENVQRALELLEEAEGGGADGEGEEEGDGAEEASSPDDTTSTTSPPTTDDAGG